MSLSPNLPVTAVEFVVATLLRLIQPVLNHDEATARGLALGMLAEYHPRTVKELRLAGEIIGLSLNALTALADAGQPNAPADRGRAASGFVRSGLAAQRRLEAMQKARRLGQDDDSDMPDPVEAWSRSVALPAAAEAREARAPESAAPAVVEAEASAPDDATAALEQAETAFRKADRLLTLMKAHHKGAPPPHSQAAQQIQAQQRVVDAARMRLAQLRRAAAPVPETIPVARAA